MPELGGNGYVIVGDAARMCMNLGYTIRGWTLPSSPVCVQQMRLT